MPKPGPRKSISELRKIMADASEKGKKQVFGKGSGRRPRLGTRGTQFAEAKMSKIKKIAEGSSANAQEAHQILQIFLEAYKGNISPPAADHQVLTNIANKILVAEKARREITLNPNQKQILSKYYKMI
jgi:hypothetical protein